MSEIRDLTEPAADDYTETVTTQPLVSAAAGKNATSVVPTYSTGQPSETIADELLLIGLVQHGDSEAFALLHGRYVDRIYRYVYGRVADRHVAEDITSHVFIKMWRKLPAYQAGASPLSAWLYRIARNAIIDHYRTKRSSVSLDDVRLGEVAYADGLDEKLDLNARIADIREALQNLTDRQRDVLILKFVEGLSAREIAQQLGKREGAVRVLQMRGLRELAKSLSLHGDGRSSARAS